MGMKKQIISVIVKIKCNPEILKKTIIILITSCVLIFSTISYFGQNKDDNSSPEIITSENEQQKSGYEDSSDKIETELNKENLAEVNEKIDAVIYVDIEGAIKNPGVIKLKPDTIVMDAIEAAGGLTSEANTKYINRASKLSDGDKIYIPTEADIINPDNQELFGNSSGFINSGTSGTGSNLSSDKNSTDAKININTADSENLQKLTGVGPATAQKIIDYRESYGKFSSLEDLMNVSGIGEKTFAKMKDHIEV